MERIMGHGAAAKLGQRAVIPVDPTRTIAVKRDVHEFEVATDAARFAEAFRAVVTDPESTFGLIRVKRPAERMGRDFEVGERFQGCFSLEKAALAALPWRWLETALALGPARRLVSFLEDALLSNYAEVRAIVTAPGPGEAYRLEYAYLEGTPIAGKSTFTIEPIGPRSCRVRQIFEYQEVNGIALGTFQRFGLKYHDQVVEMEIRQAAQRLGAEVVSSTIPHAYAELSS
jgi:hypothetical protein